MKIKNETTKRIYDIINDDINKSEKNASSITTAQIWTLLGNHVSINSVRDKIQYLIKNKYVAAQHEFYEDNKYYNRRFYTGTKQG
jgi:hypothetical protein